MNPRHLFLICLGALAVPVGAQLTARTDNTDFRLTAQWTQVSTNPPPPGVVDPSVPLHALMITGGCCHDYNTQKNLLTAGISARANVTWTVVHEGTDRDHMVNLYTQPGWATNYDVVVHNECFGGVTNVAFVNGIAAAHFAGIPAVMIHCSIHSYRNAQTDEWRKCVGIRSYSHETSRDFIVTNLVPAHPVMRGFPEQWLDPRDELYKVDQVWPDVVPLAQAYGTETSRDHVVVWVNTYGNGRIFGTTLGHGNGTVEGDVFLDLVTRGLLWACGRLDAPDTFRILELQPDHDRTVLTWQSVPGWTYAIDWAAQVSGPWNAVPGGMMTATNTMSTVSLSGLSTQHSYVRIQLLP